MAKIMKESVIFTPISKSFPHYAEEGQDFPVKFESCFASNKNSNAFYVVHGPVQCRDFLGDVACSRFFSKKYSIYGFVSDVAGWNNEFDFSDTNWCLRITFPKPENRIYFLENFFRVINLFNLNTNNISIETYLNQPANVALISMPPRCSPMFVSLFTFLIKISAQKMKGIEDFESVFSLGNITKFIEVFKQHYKNKDAAYFDRVSPELFYYIPLIFSLATSTQAFSYLENNKENVSYLHNNSGFFSQFHKDGYGKDQKLFRRLIGTILQITKNEVPFEFTPLSLDKLESLINGVKYNFVDRESRVWFGRGSILSTESPFFVKPKKSFKISTDESQSIQDFLSETTIATLGEALPQPTPEEF